MIESIIRWSVTNRIFVLIACILLVAGGIYALKKTPIDAIPDLSDVQVIIKTTYPGQAPQVVEDQVTYPLSTAMLSVPGAVTVRGFSFFGDSYVYVIFDEHADLYWARSRVLEYLSQVAPSLPDSASPQLGPDATGVGWIYLYALIDKTGKHDLGQLRSLQDWFLKYELQTVPGVSEVATVGGMVKQYQVVLDPEKLRAFNIPIVHVQNAILRANQETGASVIEMAEAEYMLRVSGYIKNLEDLKNISLGEMNKRGAPLLLKDVAEIQLGPQMRRGIAELNGEGETVGGVVVMRYGENAQATINGVKEKLDSIRKGLPEGVEIVPVYDRSDLILRAVNNLWHKLGEELLMVTLVCMLFLLHFRSSLVAIISLPVGILCAFIIMNIQGLNANIMSLGGIAIAIGTMIDGAIVLIENMHKHLTRQENANKERWQIVSESAVEVGPALFFSLLIITVSFVPVFTLEAQEGRLFAPLAYTKTWAMASAAVLSITLVPVLMGYFVRGKIKAEEKNPINRALFSLYHPLLKIVLKFPWQTIVIALLLLLSALWPLKQIGTEFMPPLDEGDLMYMPTTWPGISIGKAREILQQTDKLIRTVPEAENVFGKIGRAETATDPAPLTMIETFVQLKPKNEWRKNLSTEDLRLELDSLVKLPGLTNAWVMPIKTRIDMLATGIKTPVGIKIAGKNLKVIEEIGKKLEDILKSVPGTASVYAERVTGGRYIKIDINRERAGRYGLNIADIQSAISLAVGGKNVSWTVENLERYPINLRFPQEYRDSPESLNELPLVTESGMQLVLGDVADIYLEDGPPGIKSENARLNGWVFVDIEGSDLGTYVKQAQARVNSELTYPAGYSLTWSGQYEYMLRAKEKLRYVIPLTLVIILVLLYLNFGRIAPVITLLLTMPLSIVGSLWLMHFLNFNFSIAVGVGFIALAGIAVETGVIMLVYLDQAWDRLKSSGESLGVEQITSAILNGASLRVRPVIMTASATIVGLVPIMYGSGTGSEVMSRLAAPMVGGMVTTVLLTLFLLPAVYFISKLMGSKILSQLNKGDTL